MIGRRGFITGLVSLVAAPAIVRAGSLMPVRTMIERPQYWPCDLRPGAINRIPWPEAWIEVSRYVVGDRVFSEGKRFEVLR